ncbi:hypothetical protein H312_01403 [Anncaliia algerae PRA339]|uniref:Uncharacterized protein n=1 Tax=Anncaliia algerae PRA339 TaxID=1288291 RepID=A0A059F1N2_9MICR|nr:hypothetical protein H312_01403 [Anncaliia algerae PRA339]
MFCCKDIIICFLFLLEKITCSVTDDSTYNYDIERNKKIKEDIDEIANNFIAQRENLLNFKNCIEYFVFGMSSKPIYIYSIHLRERRKSLLNSKVEILKNGFNLDELKLYFSEDMDCANIYQIYEYRFYEWFLTSFNHTKIYFNQIDIIDEFYKICIAESKLIIEKYLLAKLYYKNGLNNCFKEIKNNFKGFINNDCNTYYIEEMQSSFAEFYYKGEDFCNIWTKCPEELKYRLIFGYNCVNLKKKEIKFNETLICNKIREIEEMYDDVINYHLNFTNDDYSLENNQKYTEMMEFIYNTELILQKCKILCQFIKENKSCIIETYYDENSIIENTVSEKKINEYLIKIKNISNEIKNNYQLKFTVNSIWHHLSIIFRFNDAILDDFFDKKHKKIRTIREEGDKIILDLMHKFFEIDDKTFNDIRGNIFGNEVKLKIFSNTEYDYLYLTSYFFSSDLFSNSSVIILLQTVTYSYGPSNKIYFNNDISTKFYHKISYVGSERDESNITTGAVNKIENSLRGRMLWFL